MEAQVTVVLCLLSISQLLMVYIGLVSQLRFTSFSNTVLILLLTISLVGICGRR